jgi:hypothetical protein
MARTPPKTGRQRRRRAKTIVDFATGEVHDRAIDAGAREDQSARALAQLQGTAASYPMAGEDLSPEELSNEDRAQLGVDTPPSGRRARLRSQDARRGWVKGRKIP